MPFELVTGRKKGGVGAAVAERNAEALGIADGDVGSPFAGRRQQGEREEIGRRGHEGARRMRGFAYGSEVANRAISGRILEQRADHVAFKLEGVRIGGDNLDAAGGRARAYDGDRLRVAAGVDEV